jgi:hypothetical protein
MHCANCVCSMAATDKIKKLRNRSVYFCSTDCKSTFVARMKDVKLRKYDERILAVLYFDD